MRGALRVQKKPQIFEVYTMKLTARGRYAVTATAALAARGEGVCASLRELSEETGISLSFLEQLFGQLRRAGVVESLRGKSGGYRLSQSPRDVSIESVIAAVDESVRAQGCTPEMKSSCTGVGVKCLTHDLWNALEGHIRDFLRGVTLDDVVKGRVGEMA